MIATLLATSPAPTIDAAWVVVVIARVLHVASAGVLLGGLVYLRQVVVPLSDGAQDRDEALYRGRRRAWARLVMLSTTFLLLSGFFNFYNIMAGSQDLPFAYHLLFGAKFLLAMLVFFVASGTAGASPLAVNMRKEIRKWLAVAIAAAVLVFALGAAMRTFEKIPRTADTTPAAADTSSAVETETAIETPPAE